MELNFNELRELVAALNQTDVAELTLKSADFELTLRKPSAVAAAMPAAVAAPVTEAKPPEVTAPPAPAPAASKPTPPPSADSNLVEITSPMVADGLHHRSYEADE